MYSRRNDGSVKMRHGFNADGHFKKAIFPKRKLLIGDDMAYMWHEDKIESMDGTRYRAHDKLQLPSLGCQTASFVWPH